MTNPIQLRPIETILNIFAADYNEIENSENYSSFHLKVRAKLINIPEAEDIRDVFAHFPERDTLDFKIKIGTDDINSISRSNLSECNNFVLGIKKSLEYYTQEEDEIIIEVDVFKEVQDGIVSIYRFAKFSEYLSFLAPYNFLTTLAAKFIESRLIHEVFDIEISYKSISIAFVSRGEEVFFQKKSLDRNRILEKSKASCHFSENVTNHFIPEDFEFTGIIPAFEILTGFFLRIRVLLSVSYLFDITSFNEDGLSFKLNGYRILSGQINYDYDVSKSLKDIPDVYCWVYDGVNVNDKIGIARNVITLFASITKDELVISDNVLPSIYSNYEIYLKQSIKQYIEVKNKVSDYLFDFNQKASKLVEGFASNFQKSIIGFVSFFVSMLVLKVINKDSKIFNNETIGLCFGLLFVSFCYLLVSIRELNSQKERLQNIYSELKKRYSDIMSPVDLDRIFNNNEGFNADLRFIKMKQTMYTAFWITIIVVSAITLFSISFVI